MFVKISIFMFIILYGTRSSNAIWVTKEKVYLIENENFLNWHDASKHCLSQDMYLVSINSTMESNNLKNYIKEKYNRVHPYWIGAYKDQGKFKWLAYNEIIEPSKLMWHEKEPNNNSGKEICIHTWEEDFDWNDNDCELKLPYICEMRIGGIC